MFDSAHAITSTCRWSQHCCVFHAWGLCVLIFSPCFSLILASHRVWFYLNVWPEESFQCGGRTCVKPAMKAASSCPKELLTCLKEFQLSMERFNVPWCSKCRFTSFSFLPGKNKIVEETEWELVIFFYVLSGAFPLPVRQEKNIFDKCCWLDNAS